MPLIAPQLNTPQRSLGTKHSWKPLADGRPRTNGTGTAILLTIMIGLMIVIVIMIMLLILILITQLLMTITIILLLLLPPLLLLLIIMIITLLLLIITILLLLMILLLLLLIIIIIIIIIHNDNEDKRAWHRNRELNEVQFKEELRNWDKAPPPSLDADTGPTPCLKPGFPPCSTPSGGAHESCGALPARPFEVARGHMVITWQHLSNRVFESNTVLLHMATTCTPLRAHLLGSPGHGSQSDRHGKGRGLERSTAFHVCCPLTRHALPICLNLRSWPLTLSCKYGYWSQVVIVWLSFSACILPQL